MYFSRLESRTFLFGLNITQNKTIYYLSLRLIKYLNDVNACFEHFLVSYNYFNSALLLVHALANRKLWFVCSICNSSNQNCYLPNYLPRWVRVVPLTELDLCVQSYKNTGLQIFRSVLFSMNDWKLRKVLFLRIA